MNRNTLKKVVIFLIIISFLLMGGASVLFAQTDQEQERSDLERLLRELEAKIVEFERDVTKTQAEREALQYEVNSLRRRIDQLNAQIRQARITAQSLAGQIKDKESSIVVTLSEIEDIKSKLSENLRSLYEEDQRTVVEILVSEKDISVFFDNSLSLERLSMENRNLLGEIITLKINLEEEKSSLGLAKDETERIAELRAAQARETEAIRRAQENLLSDAQRREATQKQELSELEKQAAEIRSRLLKLSGVPSDVPMPNLGEALDVAKWVQQHTGIHPAFLVAIILQESALGRNVGQCYLVDTFSGKTRNIITGRVYIKGIASPTNHFQRNDIAQFLNITRELGRNPLQTPVSCTMIINGAEYGYGGAMGPAQFIPSTWNSINVRPRVTAILGQEPDPWRIRDSFLASGIYLAFRGGGNPQNELAAAAGYFGQAGLGYESTVMQRRGCLQTFMDHGTMTPTCDRLIFIK